MTKTFYFFVLVVSFGLCSCASTKGPTCTLTEPETRPKHVYFSRGEGASLIDAITDARRRLAVQIGSRIDHTCSDNLSSKPERNYQTCQTNSRSIMDFYEDELLASTRCHNQHQVLIKLDKRPLAQRIQWLPNDLSEAEFNRYQQGHQTRLPFRMFGPPSSEAMLKASFIPREKNWLIHYRQQRLIVKPRQLWNQLDWLSCDVDNLLTLTQSGQPRQSLQTGLPFTLEISAQHNAPHVLVYSVAGDQQVSLIASLKQPKHTHGLNLVLEPSLLPNQRNSEESLFVLLSSRPIDTTFFNQLSADERLQELMRLNSLDAIEYRCASTYRLYNHALRY